MKGTEVTKVSELTGRKLDEWVARAEGHHVALYTSENGSDVLACTFGGRTYIIDGGTTMEWLRSGVFHPSTDPKQGQPIMERLRISAHAIHGRTQWSAQKFVDPFGVVPIYGYGETMLIAGMRARVAMVYGDEVPA